MYRSVSAITHLEELYATLPKIECQRKCNAACGPVVFASVEIANVQAAGHKLPVAQNHLIHGSMTCSALKSGGCSIYEQRPGICRLYGLTKLLECPHGCKPERWLSEAESRKFLKSIEALKKGDSVFTCDREMAMVKSAIHMTI